MRNTIAITAATGALLFGGAGVANATTEATAPESTTTVLAEPENGQNESDNTGLWGLTGLLGLLGLAGLKRRNDAHVRPGAGTVTNTPRGGAV